MKARFFGSQSAWHKWLERHHGQTTGLWVGFYRKNSGKRGISYAESLDEALCFGWIDGIRQSVDALSYAIRFTPRRKGSRWSAVNAKRVQTLIRMVRMQPSGLSAFRDYDAEETDRQTHERRNAQLHASYEGQFRAHRAAWEYFRARPPSYQKLTTWWVMSAKKEETRRRRLATLIECSGQEQVIPPFARATKAK